MRNREILQPLVYMTAAAGFGWVVSAAFLLVFYGVQPQRVQYLALLGCLALFAGGAVSLSNLEKGRIIGLCAVAGIMPGWLGSVISLVPLHDLTPSPLTYLVVPAYLALLVFVLFYPRRFRFSIAVLVIICGGTVVITQRTYTARVRAGEYDRPAIACFRWHADNTNDVVVSRDPHGWIDSNVGALLERAGVRGTVEWTGSCGERSSANRMVVLARTRPPDGSRLYHPRNGGLILYAYDGDHWIKFPKDAPTYALYSTLETEHETPYAGTMLYSRYPDGSQGGGSGCFHW